MAHFHFVLPIFVLTLIIRLRILCELFINGFRNAYRMIREEDPEFVQTPFDGFIYLHPSTDLQTPRSICYSDTLAETPDPTRLFYKPRPHEFALIKANVDNWLSKLSSAHPSPLPSRSPSPSPSTMFRTTSEKYTSFPSTPSASPPSKSSMPLIRPGLTIRKLFILMGVFLGFVLVYALRYVSVHSHAHRPAWSVDNYQFNQTIILHAAFQPPEPVPYRAPDSMDTFANYKYRNTCNISSLDLHAPYSPLCEDRQSLLTAMSSGGRIGNDAPYMPRGCDMRWFTTEEICDILSRFSKVLVIGDSMMRHVVGSLNVLLRKDLGYGAVTDWNFSPQERRDCFCNYQFNVKACSVQGIYRTSDVAKNDPDSLACQANTVNVDMEAIIKFPIPEQEMEWYRKNLGTEKPDKPLAFIFGHGLWNDLDLQATLDWLDLILDMTTTTLPYLAEPNAFFPRLFVTPNACGKEKEDRFLVTQGDKALMLFEENVAIEVNRRGVEHLGTWNMSAQSNKFDGVHLDLKGNMIKAMMVLNWLNMLEVEKH